MSGSTSADDSSAHRSVAESVFWCCFYGGGIVGALLVYGLLQERIMTLPYGEDRFTISAFLVFSNRVCAVLFSVIMVVARRENYMWGAPLWKYLAVSLSNVGATWCQYEALLYVSFPVQMLGKSFKMMPVMVWGMAISAKQYGYNDWLVAAAVTGGVTEFLMTGPTSSADPMGNSTYGLGLLLVFLALDGFTSTMQEKLFKDHKVTKYNQMLWVNTSSTLVSCLIIFVTGDTLPLLAFITKHPILLKDSFILSASSVTGQFFIYSQVKEFGALVFAATMNVRQIISIVVSYATYGTPITGMQIFGLAFVFGGLFYKSVLGLSSSAKHEKGETTPLMDSAKPAQPAQTATQ